MDKDKVFTKKGTNIFRVDKITNLKIEHYIDPEYILDCNSGGVLSETGKLVIFSVYPKDNNKLPSFIGRWDENKATLDIDIKNVDNNTESIFKNEQGSYSGHHPKRISEVTRTYKVCIKIPGRDIFIGNVTFNINHGHRPGLFG